ncbi:MAG TPA: hypothetical protein H9870_08465 [Candidatus Corynebacterium avicola]|uniref:Uncharacterized protein n=1 Tax=Candidatus Corynebacterium avicola TaxID=2838527 RepID=A0A9D1ULF5_9CORY|nr:hypothetical protein [Candidatus Corynebacterium avicola]
MTTQSRFGGTVTDPVAYSVNVDAKKTSIGWELTLDNGRQLTVTTLDDAATRVRTLLDIYQPAVNHDTVTVTLTISPTVTPAKTAAPSLKSGASASASQVAPTESASQVADRPAPTTRAAAPTPSAPAAQTTTPAASARPGTAASARPTPTYPSVGPSGLECTLWLTAAKEKHAVFSDAAVEVFPWINTLSDEQRRRCLGDIHVGLKRATEDYAYSELRDTVSRWKKISAAPPVAPTAPRNEALPSTTPATPARSSFGDYPAAMHRISAASTTPATSSRPTTSSTSAPRRSTASSTSHNPRGRHRL